MDASVSLKRYITLKGSQSRHCCFAVTIIDTTKPEMIGEEYFRGSDGELSYEIVCECFDMENAEKICRALNAIESGNGSLSRDENGG